MIKEKRCFNWADCKEPDCTKSTKDASVNELISKCLDDDSCHAVSCLKTDQHGHCKSHMISHSCDNNTMDPEINWEIHLMEHRKSINL